MSEETEYAVFYDFKVNDIDGNEVSMEIYRNKPVLVVNVATNCGLAKTNYKELNELYEKFHEQGFCIAAFPSNSFGGESGCNVDIKEFMKKNNIRFDVYEKVDVNGANTHPLFKWLKAKQPGLLGMGFIKWNFTKFLIDKNGIPIKRYAPTTSPSHIEADIVSII